jgi:predicted transcriptional regulator
VLSALWTADRALAPAEVQAALGDGLAYTTVMTILNRLHTKGELTRIADGRTFLYQPAQNTAEFTARRMRGLLEQVDDPAGVLAQFVGTLKPGEEQVLRDLLSHPRGDDEGHRPAGSPAARAAGRRGRRSGGSPGADPAAGRVSPQREPPGG